MTEHLYLRTMVSPSNDVSMEVPEGHAVYGDRVGGPVLKCLEAQGSPTRPTVDI
jgi:hypothetical protein